MACAHINMNERKCEFTGGGLSFFVQEEEKYIHPSLIHAEINETPFIFFGDYSR